MPFGNTSAGTARDFGTSLPITLTQDVNAEGSGTTPDVWYKYTAQPGDSVVGLWGFGDLTIYKPLITVYSDAGITLYLGGMQGVNVPVQFPVTPGNTYWFSFHSTTGNVVTANLSANLQKAPSGAASSGQIFINDDTEFFPAAIISSSDGSIVKFINPFPNGESGEVLPTSGNFLYEDAPNNQLILYDSTFAQLTTIPTTTFPDPAISSNQNDKFYVVTVAAGVGTLKIYSSTGALLTTQSLGAMTAARAIGIRADETIMYLSGKAGTTDSTVSKWDLVGNAWLADFAAAIAGHVAPSDILVLSDNTVVVSYQKNTVTQDLTVKTYNSAGTVLQSKSYGSAIQSIAARMCHAINDPTSFWLWIHNNDGTSTFKNVKTSDLTDIASFIRTTFEAGIYAGAATITPDRFGTSQSCPIFILRATPASNLTITKTHTYDFFRGQIGATYTLTVTNSGGVTNTGLVTVTETVPAGMTFVSMSGTGWTVVGNVATRSDTLAPGNSYPPLTVTVNVDGNALTPLINSTTVAGAFGSNNATDSTVIQNLTGMYKIVPNSYKTNDTVYTNTTPSTGNVKIPDPSATQPLIGD